MEPGTRLSHRGTSTTSASEPAPSASAAGSVVFIDSTNRRHARDELPR